LIDVKKKSIVTIFEANADNFKFVATNAMKRSLSDKPLIAPNGRIFQHEPFQLSDVKSSTVAINDAVCKL